MPSLPAAEQLPKLADEDAVRLLQAVWDAVDKAERWPTFGVIDRSFYSRYGIDVRELIARIPQLFLRGGRPQGGAAPAENGALELTVAGAANCSGTEQALRSVVAAARLAAEAYRRGDPTEPVTVTFDQVLNELSLDLSPAAERELGRQSAMLINQEPWRTHSATNDGRWTYHVDRDIRLYAGVETLDQYWRARERHVAAQQQPVGGSSSSTGTWSMQGRDPIASSRLSAASATLGDDDTDAVVKEDRRTALTQADLKPQAEGSHSLLTFVGLCLAPLGLLVAVVQASQAVWAQTTGVIITAVMAVVLAVCWRRRPSIRKAGVAVAVLLGITVTVVLIVGNAAG